ncbi:hypothetical protein CR513_54756, partial [Mucuna pruriens]
ALIFDSTFPYYLIPGDNLGIIITLLQFNGEKVKDLWNDLKQRFFVYNDVRIYQLKTNNANSKHFRQNMIANDYVESVQNLFKLRLLQNLCRIVVIEGHSPIVENMVMKPMTIFKLVDT